uniref:Uncharacterized protein n=1 Tax=Cacopsylla melanoneura TaxID=428564 RepID=A0A8D8WJI9_9HEMI
MFRLISLLIVASLTWVFHLTSGVHLNESANSIYFKNLREKTDETVLCVDEYMYLHPLTERYLVSKLHQVLHTCLNTYGKKIHIFPWPNETLRDTEHRLHSTYLKRSLFQVVENWYLNLVIFTYNRLFNFRRALHNVTTDYMDCSKKDIQKFWNHDHFFDMFFNQAKKHLRNIIRYHYVNLERAFYETSDRGMMHTYFMNATLATNTIKFTQVFKARHIVDFFHDTPSTVVVTHIPDFVISDEETKPKRHTHSTGFRTESTTVRRPKIFNLSALGFTYPRNVYRRTKIVMTSELIRAEEYENRTDLPFINMMKQANDILTLSPF